MREKSSLFIWIECSLNRIIHGENSHWREFSISEISLQSIVDLTIPLSSPFLFFLLHKLNCLRIRAATSGEEDLKRSSRYSLFPLGVIINRPSQTQLFAKQIDTIIIYYFLIFYQTFSTPELRLASPRLSDYYSFLFTLNRVV